MSYIPILRCRAESVLADGANSLSRFACGFDRSSLRFLDAICKWTTAIGDRWLAGAVLDDLALPDRRCDFCWWTCRRPGTEVRQANVRRDHRFKDRRRPAAVAGVAHLLEAPRRLMSRLAWRC